MTATHDAPVAIETQYAGYRFRSRLEARWAVFFDVLGLSWDYEPEGFDLDGLRYLPDFYIHEAMTWVEVKGSMTDADARKVAALARAVPNPTSVVVVGSIPELHARGPHHVAFCGFLDGRPLMPVTWEPADDHHVVLVPHGRPRGTAWTPDRLARSLDGVSARSVVTDPRVEGAYGAARTRRFEHGENQRATKLSSGTPGEWAMSNDDQHRAHFFPFDTDQSLCQCVYFDDDTPPVTTQPRCATCAFRAKRSR